MKVLGTMLHRHQWQSEPPEGKLMWNKSFDERYGDEEDMAANAMFNDPEEVHRLRLHLKKDPAFETSSSWPHLVEWCSTCPSSRTVRLVLPPEQSELVIKEEEENEDSVDDCKVEESAKARVQDACTQTPSQKARRRGGKGSRSRRMLAFQLMLTAKHGLPLSRLLGQQGTDAKSTNKAKLLKLQDEVAVLKVEKKQEESVAPKVKEEKKEGACFREGVPSSDSSFSTLRNSQTDANPTSSQTLTPGPVIPSFPAPPPQFFTKPCFLPTFHAPTQSPQFGQMPVASWVCCGACQTWGHVFPIWVTQ